ncbi:MAG: hypothetical protein ACYCQJ_12480 [Nitrososphaerales archaeon]
MRQYKTLTASTLPDLGKQVIDHILEDWKVYGSIVTYEGVDTCYTQTIYKE